MYQVSLCKDDPSYAPLSTIAPVVRNAIVASEDAAFWDHEGIDWVELRKSFETNIEQGRIARGGSTITQQLAKNVYLTPEKTLLRKIREAVIALRIERLYKKELILEKYLNVVEFDKNVYGVKAAARHFFGTTPGQLTTAQAAWLAFLLPNPKKYSISFHSKKMTPFAFRQMSEIVNRLGRFKKISPDERDIAINQVRNLFGAAPAGFDANYDESLAEELRDDLEEELRSGPEAELRKNSGESGATESSAQSPIEESGTANEASVETNTQERNTPEETESSEGVENAE